MLDTAPVAVETELTRYFAAARLRASDYSTHYQALWESLEEASSGGKRVRPALVLAAYAGYGGKDLAVAVPLAVSFELLHTAFLIHDDVIDHDLARRGRPNVAGRFRDRALAHGSGVDHAEVWALAAAILAGDLALSEAHRTIALLPVAAHTRLRLLDLLDRAVFVSAAGELSDVTDAATAHSFSMDAVIDTLENKTAIYSFEAPLQAGAVLAGAPEDAVALLGRFGRNVGVAFQLVDDILGVFGDPLLTGKSVLTDLREGKQTALIAHARVTPSWERIAPFVGKADLTESEAEQARALLDASGARTAAHSLALNFAARAVELVNTPLVPFPLRRTLGELAAAAVSRSR